MKELDSWSAYIDTRKMVLKHLEEQRAEGVIGGGLDAHARLTVPAEMVESVRGEEWADFLIVSKVIVGLLPIFSQNFDDFTVGYIIPVLVCISNSKNET